MYLSDESINLLLETKSKENKDFLFDYTNYNSYLEFIYKVSKDNFNGFKVPQWVQIEKIIVKNNDMYIYLGVFKNNDCLYDFSIALKHKLITFN